MVEANKHIFFKHLLDLMRLTYATFILLLALVTFTHGQQTAEDWFNKGDLLLNLGKYNESIEAYNKSIELNQSFATAWKQKGNALLNLTKYNASLEWNMLNRLWRTYSAQGVGTTLASSSSQI